MSTHPRAISFKTSPEERELIIKAAFKDGERPMAAYSRIATVKQAKKDLTK